MELDDLIEYLRRCSTVIPSGFSTKLHMEHIDAQKFSDHVNLWKKEEVIELLDDIHGAISANIVKGICPAKGDIIVRCDDGEGFKIVRREFWNDMKIVFTIKYKG